MMEGKKITSCCFVMLKDNLVFLDAFGSSSQGHSQSIDNSKVKYRWSERMALSTFKVCFAKAESMWHHKFLPSQPPDRVWFRSGLTACIMTHYFFNFIVVTVCYPDIFWLSINTSNKDNSKSMIFYHISGFSKYFN